jgi:hypothetical protein
MTGIKTLPKIPIFARTQISTMTVSIPNTKKIKLLNSDDVYAVMQNVLLRTKR